MPRWVAAVTYGLAVVLLFTVPRPLWAVLVFPAWVLCVSVIILLLRRSEKSAEPGMS
jgi:hypothetical protein